MEFKILSHAGLLVKNKTGKSLICDPWLIGSSYWRSWWNYPPVSKDLINSLHPDFIYLTHIHWDHFHGDSLKKFPPNIPIIIPKGNYTRMKDDLFYLGYNNIIELKHGERLPTSQGSHINDLPGLFFTNKPAWDKILNSICRSHLTLLKLRNITVKYKCSLCIFL